MIKVFLDDDHVLVREGLRRIVLENSLIRVVGEAADGDSLLAGLEATEPDVLLLDITMPGPGFLQLMERIRARHPGLPILVVSMHPETHYADRALKAGASGYVSKRQSVEELTRAVFKVFGGGTYVSASAGEEPRRVRPSPPGTTRPHHLSDREFEVLLLLVTGSSITGIAANLGLSPKTVSTYRLRVLKKLGMKSNADLVRYAIRNELIA